MTFDDTELQSNGVTVSHPMTSFKLDARGVLFVPTPTPRIHGYDVSYQVLGIWEGFSQQQLSISSTLTGGPLDPPLTAPHPHVQNNTLYLPRHGDFHSAVAFLCTRRGYDLSLVSTHKLEQRQFALQLCGWSVKEMT